MNNAIHDWTGAYAAHSLSEQETQEFEAHLRDCEQCREEVASFEDVLAQLTASGMDLDGDDSALPEVPASLGASVMAQIALTKQEPAPATLTAVPAAPVATSPAASNVTSLSAERQRRSPWASRMLVAAAAAMAVAAVGIGTVLSFTGDGDDTLAQVEQVRSADDAVAVQLGVGDVELIYSTTMSSFVATGRAPDLADGETYQLWIVNADGTIEAGPTFEPGDFAAIVERELVGVAAIAVSVEPDGGSEQPTTDPIAAVEL